MKTFDELLKEEEIIMEVPLPDEWKASGVFTPRSSFAAKIKYAQERAAKLGTGSSRVAFEVEYKGRPTVIKIAKNRKGIAQNEVEAEILSDHYAASFHVFIPIIDYDEEHNQPIWLHTEKAEKITKNQFERVTDVTPEIIYYYTRYMQTGQDYNKNILASKLRKKLKTDVVEEVLEWCHENEYCQDIFTLVKNYDLQVGDFERLANWGMYKGRPVIVDIGLNTQVFQLHYSK